MIFCWIKKKKAIDNISPQFGCLEENLSSVHVSAHCLLTNQHVCVSVCVCALPECSNIVAGGPAHHKAPLWTRAALTHLVHVACSPHLAHTHLGLLLKVVGWSGNTGTKVPTWLCIHPQTRMTCFSYSKPFPRWCTKHLLGFADHQYVSEEEEVSVLSLHPCSELDVPMKEERPIKAGEEGVDQWAALWAHRKLEALSGWDTWK